MWDLPELLAEIPTWMEDQGVNGRIMNNSVSTASPPRGPPRGGSAHRPAARHRQARRNQTAPLRPTRRWSRTSVGNTAIWVRLDIPNQHRLRQTEGLVGNFAQQMRHVILRVFSATNIRWWVR